MELILSKIMFTCMIGIVLLIVMAWEPQYKAWRVKLRGPQRIHIILSAIFFISVGQILYEGTKLLWS